MNAVVPTNGRVLTAVVMTRSPPQFQKCGGSCSASPKRHDLYRLFAQTLRIATRIFSLSRAACSERAGSSLGMEDGRASGVCAALGAYYSGDLIGY